MWCCWNSPNHNPVTTHASAVRNSLAAISLNDPGQVGPLLVSVACTSLTTNLALRGKVATSNRLLGHDPSRHIFLVRRSRKGQLASKGVSAH